MCVPLSWELYVLTMSCDVSELPTTHTHEPVSMIRRAAPARRQVPIGRGHALGLGEAADPPALRISEIDLGTSSRHTAHRTASPYLRTAAS